MLNVAMSHAPDQLPVDRSWYLDVNAFSRATPWLHGPVTAYAEYGMALFGLLLLAGWWLARGTRDAGAVAASLWAPVGALVALGVNQPIVNDVAEPRPYTTLPHALVLVSRSGDYSYPSDHAVMAGAVAAGLFLVNRRLGLVGLLAAVLMAFARVYVGAHYPGDVLAGLVLGAVVSLLGFVVLRRLVVLLVQQLTRTPLRPLLAAGDDDLQSEPVAG